MPKPAPQKTSGTSPRTKDILRSRSRAKCMNPGWVLSKETVTRSSDGDGTPLLVRQGLVL